jgi:hypothetical protein
LGRNFKLYKARLWGVILNFTRPSRVFEEARPDFGASLIFFKLGKYWGSTSRNSDVLQKKYGPIYFLKGLLHHPVNFLAVKNNPISHWLVAAANLCKFKIINNFESKIKDLEARFIVRPLRTK